MYGTDTGIYVSDRKSKGSVPKQVINTTNVTQLDVLEEYQLLLVLTSKTLYSFPLSALDPQEQTSPRGKKIQSSCHFFRVGICLGRHLVCCVKPTALSTTIKVYEPNDAVSATRRQRGLGRMFNSGQDELKPFKEFYIPTESYSVHFLRSKLCVACSRGFEVVALETLETQSLLDQADTSLDFVARKEGVVRPIHIERLNGEFLLNYSEFSFFVNRNGWRARPEWRIDWEGTPQSFALSYPWILAFEPNFIELRHIDSGAVHIVPHKNIRMLHSSTHEVSLFLAADTRFLPMALTVVQKTTKTDHFRIRGREGRRHCGVAGLLEEPAEVRDARCAGGEATNGVVDIGDHTGLPPQDVDVGPPRAFEGGKWALVFFLVLFLVSPRLRLFRIAPLYHQPRGYLGPVPL